MLLPTCCSLLSYQLKSKVLLYFNYINNISRAASCPGPGSPCGWDYYYSGGENAHDLKGALVGGPNQQDQWNDDRTNYAVSVINICHIGLINFISDQ